LLYFSSWFYLNCVTVSKWLCFIPHKLFTYSYSYFFLFSNRVLLGPGWYSTCAWCLRRPYSGGRGRGGRASRSSPPRPTFSSIAFFCVKAVIAVYGSGWQAVHILSIIVDLSSPFCSHI
jgi:hypothetical protein